MRGPGGWHQTHSPRMDASGLEYFFFLKYTDDAFAATSISASCNLQ